MIKMTNFEDKNPKTGVREKHRQAALEGARKKNPVSNAEIKPVKKEDKTGYKELYEFYKLKENDAKLIEAEVNGSITQILEQDWGEGNWVTEYSFDNEEDWLVFKDEEAAEEAAISRVEEDVEDNPEWFPDWILFDCIDKENAEHRFREMYDEWNCNYVDDIESEDDSEFTNRLASEMYERDLITHKEATNEDFINLDDKKEEMIDEMTNEQIADGNYGFDYYKFNFGNVAASKLLKEWNLVDTRKVAEQVVSSDGAGNTLSGYDGKQVDLDNGMVMYRTN